MSGHPIDNPHSASTGARQHMAQVLMVCAPRSVLAASRMSGYVQGSIDATSLLDAAPARCTGRPPEFWQADANSLAWNGTGYERTRRGSTTRATTFDSVFGAIGGYAGKTLLDVLRCSGNKGKQNLARHFVAAALNAAKGWTPRDVLDLHLARRAWDSFVTNGHYTPVAGVVWYSDTSVPAGTGDITKWLKSTMC